MMHKSLDRKRKTNEENHMAYVNVAWPDQRPLSSHLDRSYKIANITQQPSIMGNERLFRQRKWKVRARARTHEVPENMHFTHTAVAASAAAAAAGVAARFVVRLLWKVNYAQDLRMCLRARVFGAAYKQPHCSMPTARQTAIYGRYS